MNRTKFTSRRFVGAAAAIALSAGLMGCGNDDDVELPDAPDVGTPSPSPTPTPTPTTSGLDATQCLAQVVAADGTTVQDLVIPDVLTIDPTVAAGFPNGRRPADPVVDVILAVLFLDIDADGQSPLTFANLPLNPDMNDIGTPPSTFPFLLPPQGNPTIAPSTGTTFNFRTSGDSAYARVDRMGFPAISTALVPSDLKIPYNDASPVNDANGEFAGAIVGRLQTLTDALDDDLLGLGFNICAD